MNTAVIGSPAVIGTFKFNLHLHLNLLKLKKNFANN